MSKNKEMKEPALRVTVTFLNGRTQSYYPRGFVVEEDYYALDLGRSTTRLPKVNVASFDINEQELVAYRKAQEQISRPNIVNLAEEASTQMTQEKADDVSNDAEQSTPNPEGSPSA